MGRLFEIYLEGMEIDQRQVWGTMVLFPLKSKQNEGPDYLTLSEALETGILEITEVSAGGSVPELKATNKGKKPVLMLDGEELIGAKQNRVLNTTIMIGPESSLIIPVSCVERSRWHGPSLHLNKSENVMMFSTRFVKVESVHQSLEEKQEFRSDQMAIWEDIGEKAKALKAFSPTEAMKDIYEIREKDLDAYCQAFKLVPEQKGLLVFIGNKAAGLDFVSRENAFKRLYQKLLRSYVIEALVAEYEERKGKKTRRRKTQEASEAPDEAKAREFFKEAASCEEKKFKSVGLGFSCRYKSPKIIGAALEVDDSIPHLVFFRQEDEEESKAFSKGGWGFARTRTRRDFLFSI